MLFHQSVFALYKGATPPAVGWAAIDSLLLGALHNYRLFFIKHGMTEPVVGSDKMRLTVAGHGLAGLGAGLTRYLFSLKVSVKFEDRFVHIQRIASHPNGTPQK